MVAKGEFFETQDRYLYEPDEQAMFRWDHRAGTVHMRFVGRGYETPVPHTHRIFNDAIRSGFEITQAEYDSEQLQPR